MSDTEQLEDAVRAEAARLRRQAERPKGGARPQRPDEAARRADLLPPWQRYPDAPRFSSFWYAGGGDWYVTVFLHWLHKHDESSRADFFRRNAPIPDIWADWVASAVYGDWEHESYDETAAQVARLEREYGIVSFAAWERELTGQGAS
jgi:hypothetical protein